MEPNSYSSPSLQLIPVLLLVLITAALPPLPVTAQNADLPFDSGSTGADGALDLSLGLPPRHISAMTYDRTRKQLLLFGGANRNPTTDTDQGMWVIGTYAFEEVLPATLPPARSQMDMVFDEARDEVILFGGRNGANNGYLGDTWSWDGTDWSEITPASAPSPRGRYCMVYDSVRNEVILFGGNSGSQENETWTWDGTNWTLETPVNSPPAREFATLAFDRVNGNAVLFGGLSGSSSLNDTWIWDGTNWVEQSPEFSPSIRSQAIMEYHEATGRVVLHGGRNGSTQYRADAFLWDGTNWEIVESSAARFHHCSAYDSEREEVVYYGGKSAANDGATQRDLVVWDGSSWTQHFGANIFTLDTNEKPDGIWNFTTIDIPSGMNVYFERNTRNTPVIWLASGNVNVSGYLHLEAESSTGYSTTPFEGGPGGFDGGLGGSAGDPIQGTPGDGPGGGAAGVAPGADGGDGTFEYGNAFLVPMIGGSGGGGEAGTASAQGRNGGGGGGAILIASSGDINLSGTINTARGTDSSGRGGNGSHGAVKLVADRILGHGIISNAHRVRLEAYVRNVRTTNVAPDDLTYSLPLDLDLSTLTTTGSIQITDIAGNVVAQPPSGDFLNPDVIFNETGPITVTVTATNVPDGTPVTLRITSGSTVINLPDPMEPDVTLSGGTATFNTTVPAGTGSVQAFADYEITP